MPKFPRKESDIFRLAYDMMIGYQDHLDIFVHADWIALINSITNYNTARSELIEARAFLAETTETKNIALELLTQFAAIELKRSEADCAAKPENLKYIGWSARSKPSPQNHQPPGQPRNLSLKTQSPDTVILDWKPPITATGGTVRSYGIQRRQFVNAPDTDFTPWQNCGVAIDTETILYRQPTNTKLEYRITAINKTAPGKPSNTTSCVL